MKIFANKQNRKNLEGLCLVIGGGAQIDEAKIWAKRNKKKLLAIPTTGAGASETTHAVVWGKTKKNVKTEKPTTILPPFKIKLSKITRRNTCYDILGHLVDYLNVCSDNEVVEVGTYMGKLIEQHPTNLTHPASYPLTLKGMPHGEAVGRVLFDSIKKAFPLDKKG